MADGYLNGATFIVDTTSMVNGMGGNIDWTLVPESYRANTLVVTTTAVAAQAATQIAVAALPKSLGIGDVLYFGAAGKYARVNQVAAEGATLVKVDPLPVALASGDKANLNGSGNKYIPNGTVMARLASGYRIPRSLVTGSETADSLLIGGAEDNGGNAGYSGYGEYVGGVLYENMLPDADAGTGLIPAGYKTELKNAGCTFVYRTYSDSRNDNAVPLGQ